MPHKFCFHLVPWYKLYRLRIDVGESPCNLFLPDSLSLLINSALKAFQQQPSQNGSILLVEFYSLSK
jgi:hypothetical protein